MATYAALLAFSKFRAHIALSSAALFVLLGILPVGKVFSSVDWNVIMMIAGTMGIVFLFIESKMPSLLADLIIQKMPRVKWVIIALALFAGIAKLMDVDPTILYFGLFCGATLGGNLTPSVASANITALGILRKNGFQASTWDFMKISIPFTLTAVVSGYLLVWLIWM